MLAHSESLLSLPKRFVHMVLMAFILSFSSSVLANTEPQTVYEVDLDRYQGTWYEIARKPTSFQFLCYRNVTATYRIKSDGGIKVENRCKGLFGETIKADGNATVGDSTAKLKVSFIPDYLRWLNIPDGDYWVLALDEEYRYVMVGSPKRNYLWILSRTQTMPADVYQNYLNLAQNQGYDISNVRVTRQH